MTNPGGATFSCMRPNASNGVRNGLDPPFSPINVSAFCTTNFQSRFAMRGAECHGNNRRDSTTRIPSRSIGQVGK